jgi:hypothetical protein
MAKRTDEMKTYEDTKGDLEEQLRQEIAERRNIDIARFSVDGKDHLGEFPGAVGSDSLLVTTNVYDEEGKLIPRDKQVDSLTYSIDTPPSEGGFPSSVQKFGFNVETPASAYPAISAIHQKARDNSAPRSELIRDLREAGVSMPDFAERPESVNFDIFTFTDNLLKRPGVAGDATQAGRAQGREAREANVARIRAQKDRVRGMQQMLASQGFYEGDPDGVYDEKTVRAIRAAQAAGVNVPPTAKK